MKGLLLINLGTPQNCSIGAVRQYLREFLMDKRVIDCPYWLRFLLVYGFILPFRAPKTYKAYQSIWTDKGSPLLIHSITLTETLSHTLGIEYKVALGMRYGNPSIEQALQTLKDCDSITILPLFPQYAHASTGSALAQALSIVKKYKYTQNIQVIESFYKATAYIESYAQHIKKYLSSKFIQYYLFSYHGLPQRQNHIVPTSCLDYKNQCTKTTQLLVDALSLHEKNYGTCFQSRLGSVPWITPYTDALLPELIQKGIQHIAIISPSFICDCLETLEEINIRLREQWKALGGQTFIFVPALNNNVDWIKPLLEESSSQNYLKHH